MAETGLGVRPAYLTYHWLWRSLDWLYPPACGGCGKPGSRWCRVCQQEVSLITAPLCRTCGQPVNSGDLCTACKTHPPGYDQLRSFSVFAGPIRNALHRLKYRGEISLGDALAEPLIDFWGELKWGIDCVAPVPLSAKRIQARGYNQAAFLAKPIALAFGRPYIPAGLVRVRDTASQVGLTADQRRLNVEGAFDADPHKVRGKTVLIVDDVTTTGSTISACAAALKLAGADVVYGLTLARALHHNNN